jgi:hypothetical protein
LSFVKVSLGDPLPYGAATNVYGARPAAGRLGTALAR